MPYHINAVRSRKDLEAFIRFPELLYKDCPLYVPALRSDQRKTLTRDAALAHCSREMWLVRDGNGNVCGRICAIINPRYNERYGTRRARFGWFDTIDDPAVARLLLGTAEAWARERGMREIHGPLAYNTMGRQGLLVGGFDLEPVFNTLYNYPYYKDLLEANGYVKDFDWLEYRFAVPDTFPEKFERVSGRLMERYRLREAELDRLKRDPSFVRRFFRLYNDSFDGRVPHFIPFTDAEAGQEARAILPYIDGRYSSVLLDENGEIAAFAIGLPNLSPALRKCRGRLFPFGWLQLLKALRSRTDTLDFLLIGAAPKWQDSGISSLFHNFFFRRAREMGVKRVRTNPQIESNPAAHVWRNYGSSPAIRRRCYLKALENSPEIP